LWLRLKQPIIIYDGNARRALGTADGDLSAFYMKWRAQYRQQRDKILGACKLLPKLDQFCIDPSLATPAYITAVTSTEWFQERVFDIYLWHTGV
jgi:hypothetical protein